MAARQGEHQNTRLDRPGPSLAARHTTSLSVIALPRHSYNLLHPRHNRLQRRLRTGPESHDGGRPTPRRPVVSARRSHVGTQRHHAYQPTREGEIAQQIAVEPREVVEWRIESLQPREARSEEHTSELQSLTNLVCRLLLEKKKKKNIITTVQSTNMKTG